MSRVSTVLLCMLLSVPVFATELSRPAGLEPSIAFWRTVFAEVTSEQALVHDNRELSVVYETVNLPKKVSNRQRRRIADQTRGKYKRILLELAQGKRDGLTTEEKRVLALWPDDVTTGELRAASKRIRFQQGLSDRFRAGLVRSGRWEDYILKTLADASVPLQLASLPHVESSYNPAARSHVGASGLWQFTGATGRRFMQIDHVVDERRDPYESSDAAAALLKYNYSILKSWPLAITAYNHGVAGMRRAVRSTGTDDIETIIREYKGRAFGFASRNFYVAFLAANDVAENAEKYFGVVKKDPPERHMIVAMEDYVTVDTLAESLGVSRSTLKANNPALLKSVWTDMKYVPRGFRVRVPADAVSLDPGAVLAAIPNEAKFARQTPDLEHRVERGDSLSIIAARYDTSVSELMAINNLRSRHRIRVGQVINLPYKPGAAAISTDADTYVVRSGDTISDIAMRAGVRQGELLAMNSIGDGRRIYPGQTLIIRMNGESTAAEVDPAVVESATAESAMVEPEATPAAAEPAMVESAIDDPAIVESAIVESAMVAAATRVIPEEPAVVAVAPPVEPEPEPEPEPEATVMIVESGTETDVSEGAAEIGAPASAGADTAMLADPSDYLVADDGTIEIQAAETLGHYADWLGIRTQRLRDLNGYSFRKPVVIGRRLKLILDDVSADEFATRRTAYHRELQEAFFAQFRIVDTKVHALRRGESLFVLSLRRYKVPVWLLRQYNPDLDIDRLRPGAEVVFPQIERAEMSGNSAAAVAVGSSGNASQAPDG
ncbi:MAG: LysM peptidoglycan-binding domain-containing protein [Gammaproteobacteria bacterium]